MDLVELICSNLTPDLLKREFKIQKHPLAGHCYVASEVYYHLSNEELTPQVLKHEDVNHWYLQRKDGLIIDLTALQFNSFPDYSKGRGIGFLTKKPSKRAIIVIRRVLDAGYTKF